MPPRNSSGRSGGGGGRSGGGRPAGGGGRSGGSRPPSRSPSRPPSRSHASRAPHRAPPRRGAPRPRRFYGGGYRSFGLTSVIGIAIVLFILFQIIR